MQFHQAVGYGSSMPLRSSFPDFPIVDAPVHDYVLSQVSRHDPKRAALTDSSTGRSIKYGEIRPLTYKLASALRHHGFKKGDVVTVCLPNCVDYPVLLMACYCNGASISTVNAHFTAGEFFDHFENAGSRFVFGSSTNAKLILEAAQKLGNQVQKIFILGNNPTSSGSTCPAVVSFESLLRQFGASTSPPSSVGLKTRTDVAWLPSSSGTTGKPKCLMLSHFNVVGMIQVFGNDHFPQLHAGDHVIGQLPMYHMYGFTVMWMNLVKGASMIVMNKFDQKLFLELIQKYKVPILYIVPPILVFLAKHPLVDQYDLSSVHTFIVRSAPISKELSEAAMKRHKNVKYLLQAFGMSEIGAAMMMPPSPPNRVRHGSCGVLMPNFQAKIVDLDNGKELGPNESGELYLKSETRMLGYLKNPKATAEAIDHDGGWLRTGDVAYFDKDGYFYIIDRLKEMIKVNAYQVAPAELEGILLSHADVQDAAVYGIPHPQSGEVPRAMVVKKAGSNLTTEELIQYVNGQVMSYKHLRGGVEFADAITKSPSGKILRRVLRDNYKKSQETKSKL